MRSVACATVTGGSGESVRSDTSAKDGTAVMRLLLFARVGDQVQQIGEDGNGVNPGAQRAVGRRVGIGPFLVRAGQIDPVDPGLAGRSQRAGPSSAYRAFVPHSTATRGECSAVSAAIPSAATGPGLIAAIPPAASRLAMNVVRPLCSAIGPSGINSAAGLSPPRQPRRPGRAGPRSAGRRGRGWAPRRAGRSPLMRRHSAPARRDWGTRSRR